MLELFTTLLKPVLRWMHQYIIFKDKSMLYKYVCVRVCVFVLVWYIIGWNIVYIVINIGH